MTIINVPHDLYKYVKSKQLDANFIMNVNLILARELTGDEINDFKNKCKTNGASIKDHNDLHIKVVGTYKSFVNLFNITLYEYVKNKKVYFSNDIAITLPSQYEYINDIVGLNNLELLKNYNKRTIPPLNTGPDDENNRSRGLNYFTPKQIASLYKFPINYNGLGQKIAIIELGGGYKQSDLNTYFQYLNLNPKPTVTSVLIDGGTNNPGSDGDSFEVVLDIQIAGAVANASTILVYFAPNTFKGFYDAVYAAINDTRKPTIISISWGAPEKSWGTSFMNTFNSLFATAVQKGINIYCASGDNGSSDGLSGLNVDFPASSPNVIGCGGTTLNASDTTIQNETVWNGTGGGMSTYFNKPTYQNSNGINTTKRCVPDASGNADPNSGYLVYLNNNWWIVGGTSAVSPLLSGLNAKLNQAKGKTIGFINTKLYQNKPIVKISQGSNGAYGAYPDGRYNLCTGLGRMDGSQVLTKL